LITPANNGLLECIFPAGDADRLSLIQLHLPGWVQLEHVSPAAIETSRQTDKLILTVAANIQLPQIHY
jgi:hypothetical protein